MFGHMPYKSLGIATLHADGTVTYEDAFMGKKGSLEKFVKGYAKAREREPDATFLAEMPYLLTDRTWAEAIPDEGVEP